MATFTAPFLVPLFLGMTFDARHTRPGVDIFDLKYVDDPKVTEYQTTKSIYKVTSSMKEVTDTLDISGDLSLKIKMGMLQIEGKGAYLKSERDFQSTVEILTHLEYTSKTKFFKDGVLPKKGWSSMYSLGVLGTHYVSSVNYGAELIASARFVVHNTSDSADVKAEVNAALGSGGSGVDLVAEGKLKTLAEKVSGKANLEISYYGTVPLKSIPNTIEGLQKLIENFKEQIDETDLKEGIPMSVELTPLTAIADPGDEEKFQFLKNKDLENQLFDFEEQLDELRQARLNAVAWAKTLPFDLDDKYQNEVGHLIKNISMVMGIFYDVVWKMDLTKGPEQLKPAFDAYDYDGEGEYRKYYKLFLKLKAKLAPFIKPDPVTSDTYIQYGNSNCTGYKSVVLYEGFTVSSGEEGIGGTAKYDCVPRSAKKGYELTDEKLKSHLVGIRYTKLEKNFNPFVGKFAKKIAEKGIPCAKCHATDSATVTMLPATEECPLMWDLMYKGYLMSARVKTGYTSEYVCVDKEPSEPYKMDNQPQSRDTLALTTIHSQGSLPKSDYLEGALVRCVVCAF